MRRVCTLLLAAALFATIFASPSQSYNLRPQRADDIVAIVGEDHPWGGDDPGTDHATPVDKGRRLERASGGNTLLNIQFWFSRLMTGWLRPTAPTAPVVPATTTPSTPRSTSGGSN